MLYLLLAFLPFFKVFLPNFKREKKIDCCLKMLPLNLFYFYLIVMEEISLCIVQTRSHFPRNETEKLPNIAILLLLLQSPRIRRQLNNLPRKEKQRSCWLLTTRLWLCVRFRFRFRFCQPGIWVKELHVVELPNLEEEGNKLGLYEIEFHRLAFFPLFSWCFFEMQVNCDISHPVCGGSGLSGLPGSNACLQEVRRRRSTQMWRAKGGGGIFFGETLGRSPLIVSNAFQLEIDLDIDFSEGECCGDKATVCASA